MVQPCTRFIVSYGANKYREGLAKKDLDMIHRIFSELPTFKQIDLNPGLNILLASKTPSSSSQQTRNGAGKSSLVEILHFLLGSKCKPDSIFKNESLQDFNFGLELTLDSEKVIIERSGDKPSKLRVDASASDSWLFKPKLSKKTGDILISNANWSDVLGDIWFDVTSTDDGEEEEGSSLSFRQLISYFARRQTAGGFEDPFKFYSNQYPVSIQSCMFYFFGLDQYLPQKWNLIREREKTIKELKTAMSNGLLKEVVQSTTNLRTQIALTEKRIIELDEQLRGYKVLPEYEKVEAEATKLIHEINGLSNQDTIDKQALDELERTLSELPQPDMEQVELIYKEAGVIFPENVTKRLEDLADFHKSIYRNRKNYLEGDIHSLKQKISERHAKKKFAEEKYAQNMSLLGTHGALDTHVRLSAKRDEAKLKLVALKDQFDVALSLETNKTKLESERAELMSQLVNEYREQVDLVNLAITTFEDISSKLYEEAGSLHIGESLNGPTFEVKIHGEQSKGIRNIQIFCLDMTIMSLMVGSGRGPRFLVHDSHIFDGVDERQVAKAIEIGREMAESLGFQYIVTMNSDSFTGVSQNFVNKEKIAPCILSVHLTDESETGGLFGMRFN